MIIIAPDSFKESLSAIQVTQAIAKGIRKVCPTLPIQEIPMADGGEGTIEAVLHAVEGKKNYAKVQNPLGKKIWAYYAVLTDNQTVIIEIAQAIGLHLLKKKARNPLKTHTFGLGELIKNALDEGYRKFIIGLGGSATNDAGVGMLQALGAKILDKFGQNIDLGGENLAKIQQIDLTNLDARLKECEFIIASDVQNPLLGQLGASRVFAHQKGANNQAIEILENALHNFSQITDNQLNTNFINHAGAGAAGGLGFAFLSFFPAKIQSGIALIMQMTDLENQLKDCPSNEKNLVITGEGRLDFQTQFGKTPLGVAQLAQKYQLPVVGICGSLGEGIEILYEKGFQSIFSIIDQPMTLAKALKNADKLLENTAERIIRLWLDK